MSAAIWPRSADLHLLGHRRFEREQIAAIYRLPEPGVNSALRQPSSLTRDDSPAEEKETEE